MSGKAGSKVQDTPPPVIKSQPVDNIKVDTVVKSAPVKSAPEPNPTPVADKSPASTPAIESNNVFIAIQVGASKNPQADNSKYANMEGVKPFTCSDGFTRYIIGSYTTADTARKKLAQVKSAGHPDAFLTAFNGKQRITLPEAEKLLKRP